MPRLAGRVRVLFTDDQLRRLQAIARSQGRSVGPLVREAVEATYLRQEQQQRLAAVEALVAMRLPVADWEQMEQESARGCISDE